MSKLDDYEVDTLCASIQMENATDALDAIARILHHGLRGSEKEKAGNIRQDHQETGKCE